MQEKLDRILNHIRHLELLLAESENNDLRLAERASFAAITRGFVADIRRFVEEDALGDSYMLGKLNAYELFHLEGLGFTLDPTVGRDRWKENAADSLHKLKSAAKGFGQTA